MATGDSSDLAWDARFRSIDAEKTTFAVPTQNRFVIPSGRGNGQEDRDYKRKKVCSDGSTGDERDCETQTQRFVNLTTDEKLLCLSEAINRNFEKIDNTQSINNVAKLELRW
ncbi:hypothetical protein DPMN_073371 [Dreissena polymorpha]|uniref:Uncharacterized protein n=1 Tax=Dreissena polymorpha TaxID=45954 RepID=A0A9D4HAY0_DREPO|nr:hypothetical protein DPMN_073371 [Dreissena polymorpha]